MKYRSSGAVAVLITLLALLTAGTAEAETAGYIDRGDGTVKDTKTGLIWLKNANCLGDLSSGISWAEAMGNAESLRSGQCGLSDGSVSGDWRLPTLAEWRATTAGTPFVNLQVGIYWLADEYQNGVVGSFGYQANSALATFAKSDRGVVIPFKREKGNFWAVR